MPNGADDPLAFSRWNVYVPEDSPYIQDYFETAFDSDIQNLGVFLNWLLPGNVGYEGSPIKFIERFYSPAAEIAGRLTKAEGQRCEMGKWVGCSRPEILGLFP